MPATVYVPEPELIDIREGEEDATVGVAEYLGFWGCDPCYDRAPRLPGDGYTFYNYGPENDIPAYLQSKLLPAITRQLQDTTMSANDRENFEKIEAYVKERLKKEFGVK